MTIAKRALWPEQTPTPGNFLTPFSIEEEPELAQVIRNFVKEKLQAHSMVLQEIISSNLKVKNDWLERLSWEVSLELTQNNLKMKQRWLKKTLRYKNIWMKYKRIF